jgi:uncharacterized protein (DUF1778 family)
MTTDAARRKSPAFATTREDGTVTLDSLVFVLDKRSFSRFVGALDKRPLLLNRGLRRLLWVKSPWRT